MRIILATLGASALIACGDRTVNVILVIDAPPPEQVASCLGVAGFEVIVSPTGKTPQPQILTGTTPIQDPQGCALPKTMSVEGLAVDSPVSISVNGYDGTGQTIRVTATKTLENLQEGTIHLTLVATPPTNTVLFLRRTFFIPAGSDSTIKTMEIRTQQKPEALVSVDRQIAGPFWDPEPGAYSIPAGLLSATGADSGIALSIEFPGTAIPKGRATATWDATKLCYYAQ